MARIKFAYIGGGSTRAPGTMASFVAQGENFNGSEVVLIDLREDELKLVQTITQKLIRARGLDIAVSVTTDRRAGLQDCNAVLTSFRPGGFEARYMDESIPLKYRVIGQETQGPGGFMMALRSIYVMQSIVKDMEEVCPNAWLLNYTNPINIVLEAVTHHSDLKALAFCEGSMMMGEEFAEIAGLDPAKMDIVASGLNHGTWSSRHLYDGQDLIPLLEGALERQRCDLSTPPEHIRKLELACAMNALPNHYFQYYYYSDQILAELRTKTTTRAQDIMAKAPNYWAHYREVAEQDVPQLDPGRSRGGIHELELALDVMDAIFNDRREVWYVNLPNQHALPDLPPDRVVEVLCMVDKHGAISLQQPSLPPHVAGLVDSLSYYQLLAAEAGWCGTRKDAIRALAGHPLVMSWVKAEMIYDEMAAAHQEYLPERLLR
jgi:6-phospho-beta-glucosidase